LLYKKNLYTSISWKNSFHFMTQKYQNIRCREKRTSPKSPTTLSKKFKKISQIFTFFDWFWAIYGLTAILNFSSISSRFLDKQKIMFYILRSNQIPLKLSNIFHMNRWCFFCRKFLIKKNQLKALIRMFVETKKIQLRTQKGIEFN
jgi:hypothetical protein